jgi:hypothetical protein
VQQLTNVEQVTGVLEALLQGVRACAPKCAECTRPLGDEQEQSHLRASGDGTTERVCHRCFIDEVAEALVNQAPGLS